MKTITYIEFAIAIFNKLEEIDSSFSSDRISIEKYLNNFIEGHNSTLEKYGKLHCLDTVFMREIAKYYEAIYSLPIDSFAIVAANILNDKRLSGFKISTEECFVLYPSFVHKKRIDGGIDHKAIVDAYIFNGTKDTHVNPNIREIELERFIEVIKAHSYDVAEFWTKEKNATKDEISLIADEILAVITLENKAAYKKDIMEYLAKDTNKSEILRFL